jgi:predicted helicase
MFNKIELLSCKSRSLIRSFLSSRKIQKNKSPKNKIEMAYPIFIITTYHSSYLLNKFSFDFKISDECHHLVSFSNSNDNDSEKFINFHNIKAYKSLFMTATEKIINDPKSIYRQYIKVRNIKDDQQQIEANSQKNKN